MATPKVEANASPVSPLSVGETFNTYAEAELRIHQWGEQNHTLFIKTDGKRVKHEDLQHTVGYEYISYACKQGGPPRVGSGRGIRVNQRTLKTNCPVKLRLVHEIIEGEHKLVIKTLILDHNHEISELIYKGYPENRRASITPELVDLLNSPEVSNTVVRDFIKQEQGVLMLPRDVNNLRKRVHSEAFPKSEDSEYKISDAEKEFCTQLIQEIQTHSCLYDPAEKNNKGAIEITWGQVAQTMNTSVAHARRKWSELKNAFCKYLNPNKVFQKPKNFPFLEDMAFLQPYLSVSESSEYRTPRVTSYPVQYTSNAGGRYISSGMIHQPPEDSDVSWFKGLLPLIKCLTKKRKRQFISETTNLLMTLADENDNEEDEKTSTIYIFNK
ncbi:hypothetical protein EGW08_013792 [Elysia chlorotica]|uniref:MADF domain-containing protein n=1 Tax=Elysia chlorotica TaxID=188477 RepID=A0A3S0ZMI8_ELYCH|nr:hypothetical protein EGW08_013792 [Elysia chlorotica]